MVLLTMTSPIVEALKLQTEKNVVSDQTEEATNEPSLRDPSVGKPISHGQVVDLWKRLRGTGEKAHSLELLLQGSKVYTPPPPSKPEPSNEYKALMARLRRDEEERAYERMMNSGPTIETFAQRFPGASSAQAFATVNRPGSKLDTGDDEVTYNDVHRQLMLIFNFAASIFGVAATLWVLARWWPTPARLFLAMGGGIAVGIAEVTLYSGYIWHLDQAKKKEVKLKEVRQIKQSWVVGPKENVSSNKLASFPPKDATSLRRRKTES